MTDEPLVWTQAQVAEMLQVDVRTVRRATKSGELRPTYIGRLPRYLPSDVQAYMAHRRQRVA